MTGAPEGPTAPPGGAPSADADTTGSVAMRPLARATMLSSVVLGFGQAFAFGREIYIAGNVGASAALAALLIASVLPSVVGSIIGTSLQAAVVPAYMDLVDDHGEAAGRRFLGTVLVWTLLISAALSLVILGASEQALALAGPGLSAGERLEAASFLVIVTPILATTAVGGVLAAACQIHRRFTVLSMSLASAPIVSLVLTIALWERYGLMALAAGITIGAVVSAVGLALALLALGIVGRPAWRPPAQHLSALSRHLAPLIAGTTLFQLNPLIDRAVATLLGTGAVGAFRYGSRLVSAPLTVVQPAWSVVIYPALVRTARPDAMSSIGLSTMRSLQIVAALFVPIVFATAAMAPALVDLVYRRGAFDDAAASMTTMAVAGFAPLLYLSLTQPILQGVHNAKRRGALLGTVAAIGALLNLTLDVLLGLTLGVGGLALATSSTLAAIQLILAWKLRSMDGFDLGRLITGLGRVCLASLPAALPIAALYWIVRPRLDLLPLLASLVGTTVLGAIVYVVGAYALGIREPWMVVRASIAGLGRLTGTRR